MLMANLLGREAGKWCCTYSVEMLLNRPISCPTDSHDESRSVLVETSPTPCLIRTIMAVPTRLAA
jgi:hypothetical protein